MNVETAEKIIAKALGEDFNFSLKSYERLELAKWIIEQQNSAETSAAIHSIQESVSAIYALLESLKVEIEEIKASTTPPSVGAGSPGGSGKR